MGAYNRKDLKAYVRFDGTGRVVPSSLILRRKKPKVGKWVEIPAYECCNPINPTTTTTSTTTASPTTTTTTSSPGPSYGIWNLYSNQFSTSTSTICLQTAPYVTVYTSTLGPLGIGVTLYTDTSLTTQYFIGTGMTGVIGLGTPGSTLWGGGPFSGVITSDLGTC